MNQGGRPRKLRLPRRWLYLMALGLIVVGWMVPGLASAWLTWTGIDPVVSLGSGHSVSVYVEWPTNFTCTIRDPITVKVAVPRGVSASVLNESAGDFTCRSIATKTSVENRSDRTRRVDVAVNLDAAPTFPVKVHVSVDGKAAQVFQGTSNSVVSGSVTY